MEKDGGLIKSIFMGHFIIVLHLLLIAVVALLVLFFSGVVAYAGWILSAGLIAVASGAYYFYRRMKAEGKTLREILRSPLFRGRSVEVSVLGGLASIKIDNAKAPAGLLENEPPPVLQLEDRGGQQIRELAEMARLLEKNLVTLEEYNKVKERLLKF
jgi:hypothetical protein